MRRFLISCFVVWASFSLAQAADPTPEEKVKLFTEQMSGVKLIGQFTVVGKDDKPLTKEAYVIEKVEKMPEGDKWLFQARIQYGTTDVLVPLPLDVKWAGDTAVITLTDVTIPGMGTFSSRVLIHEKKYAGTWRHDAVGGHLFGVIEKLKPEDLEKKPAKKSEPKS